jgi:hypothetical protein
MRTNRPKINGFLLWLLVPKSVREMALVKSPGLVISTPLNLRGDRFGYDGL